MSRLFPNTFKIFLIVDTPEGIFFTITINTYSGFQAGVDTPEAKIFRFVRPAAPEIFDRVAFERELKGNFAHLHKLESNTHPRNPPLAKSRARPLPVGQCPI